jgi:coenzyme Q-binding protein COQ10
MTAITGGWSADFPRHAPEQLFHLAADIEAYPRFIPWCLAARVRRRGDTTLDVDNRFGAGPLQVGFRSQAEFVVPSRLDITSSDGPFRRFHLCWRFTPRGGGGCRVSVEYEMELHSGLLNTLARLSQHEAERRVARRFGERAREVYGDPVSPDEKGPPSGEDGP